ncbi:adhesion G-protein coupled receptor G6 [Symphorus nematophorus]
MDSVRSLSPLTICLCILLSLCLLGSSASASSTLWGKKIHFNIRRCLWQLHPDTEVPPLKELSVCLLLRLNSGAPWTGFDYKAPGKKHTELGLRGKGADLEVRLFEEKHLLEKKLIQDEWYSVCLTWSGRAPRLRVYINGTSQHEALLNSELPRELSSKGTLTLGVPHYVENGQVMIEHGADLIGEIGLFRMWARERSPEELRGQSCADGDVVSWDAKQWKYSCNPLPDNNLQCAVSAKGLIILLLYMCNNLSFSCEFYVNVDPAANVEVVQAEIAALLNFTFTYNFLKLTSDPNNISILPVVLENCLEETISTIYGQYIWPETFPGEKQAMVCKKPESERANRLCKLDIETDTTSWAQPDMRNCKALVNISGIINITVTADNAAEVVDVIEDLVDAQLGNSAELSASEVDTVVEKLSEVVDISIIEPAVGADIVNIVADILLSKTNITPVANTVLNLTERMGNNMDFQDESVSVTAPLLALSMINVDQNDFKGLTFGVSSMSSPLIPEDPITSNATQSSLRLNSHIVSASINNSHVINLKDRVVVTLRHQTPKQQDDKVQCGQGGWNSRGCETRSISSNRTSCLCDHLTHFAVLLDVSRGHVSKADSQIMTVISYLGCGISSIFLGVTLLTYLAFETLRRDYPSKILINLSAALLGLNMLFLLDSWLSSFSNYGLCIATAATLHYFLLASFTWMGLEAVHMYFALVKVFNTYIPSYILKFCAVGWGVPLAIVSLVLAIDIDAYGSIVTEEAAVMLQSTDPFCWLQNDVFFYVTVAAFFLLILLCNIFVFIVVLIQIRRMKANKLSGNSRGSLHDLRAVAGLTVLLGLTWALGFFSFGPGKVVLLYLFCIFNSFQGFFVFLFHCLMKENVRKQWKIHLCCGRFRLSDYSDWSRTLTVGGGGKKKNLVNSDSVASDNTSSIRKVSGSSAGSAPNHHQGA